MGLTERPSTQDEKFAGSVAKFSLIKAWLDPEQYLSDVFDEVALTEAEKQLLIKNIQTYQDLREWLTSINASNTNTVRYGLAFAYRNQFANDIAQILSADGLSNSYLLDQLNLFSNPPREFPQLDRAIADLCDRELAIQPFSNS